MFIGLRFYGELITEALPVESDRGRLGMKKDEEDDNLEKIAKLGVSLEGKDYIALIIAALETIFLPLLILIVVMVVVVLLLR